MNQAQLPEVASWVGITQGTNSLHAVLYSTADKYMVYFVKHVLLFCSQWVSFRSRTWWRYRSTLYANKKQGVLRRFLMLRWLYGPNETTLLKLPELKYSTLAYNPVDSTAKTSLPWHTLLWMHSVVHLWELCERNSQKKHLKLTKTCPLRSHHQTSWWNSSARGISLIGSHTATQETN